MPETRCDLILLGWTLFVGLNFVSDFVWGGGSGKGDSGGGSGLATWSSEIYRGTYRASLNGTTLHDGEVRMTLATQQAGIASVQVSSLAVALRQGDSSSRVARRRAFSSFEQELTFKGVELGSAHRLVAEGEHRRPDLLWGRRCQRLDAAVQFTGSPQSRFPSSPDAVAPVPPTGEAEGGGPKKEPPPPTLDAHISSPDCGLLISFTAKAIDLIAATQKIVHYSIFANVITILQIRCYLVQMRFTEDGPSAARVSIVCIGIQALMDAYDSFLHLCLGLSNQYMFNTIAVVSLFKFVLFSLFEARYMLSIWRHRRPDVFAMGWDAMRRELSWQYSRFYGILIVGMVLVYHNISRLDLIVLGFQAYWLPQIASDVWHGCKSALSPWYIVDMSVTRLLFACYLFGCPNSIFSDDLFPRLPGAPSASLCMWMVGLQAFQVAVMLSQRRWGPRWFVPWACMPWAYNYHRRDGGEQEGLDCVICMLEVDAEEGQRVVTPCGHAFHNECLQQWMDVKMECPTCRTTLPPIQ